MIHWSRLRALALANLVFSTYVSAHTWADCVKFNPQTKRCMGYSRNYPGRASVTPIDDLYTYRLEGPPNDKPICDPNRQAKPDYPKPFSMATMLAGESTYLKYQINGHHDLKDRQVYVLHFPNRDLKTVTYRDAIDGIKTNTVHILGQGPFINKCDGHSDNSNCWLRYTIPKDFKGSVMELVFLWDMNQNTVGERYTSCFDLNIVGLPPAKLRVGGLLGWYPSVSPPSKQAAIHHRRKCRSHHPYYLSAGYPRETTAEGK
ncbi:hypothetical protein IWQ62_001750 [Dispira parvispora]|uniref:Uncharacterized protein n=1 Tax=Dispira parvispora TaxID=1520584 RepID=A0A9W8E3H1_9FUNG|nr:hypothetical protein IWQ62_001750 [Dispira parvispora]